jgi:hypothetical protein
MDIFDKVQAGKEPVALRLYALSNNFLSGTELHVDVVYVKDATKDYVQSMGFYQNYHDEKNQYKNLKVKAHCFGEFPTPGLYEIHIDNSRDMASTLDNAMAMVKVLKPIVHKMNKIEMEQGHHLNFEEYICRLATVLKVKSFYHKSTKSLNDSTEYRIDDITQLRAAIKDMIAFNVPNLQVA